jgi:ribosomal protein S6
MSEEIKDLQVYEISFWLISTLSEDKLNEVKDSLQSMLAKHGALVIKSEEPALADIAYPMDKIINNKRVWFTTGYFGWIKFDVEPAKVDAIVKDFESEDSIIRMLCVKTIREDTMSKRKKEPRVATMKAPKLEEIKEESSFTHKEEEKKEEVDNRSLDEKIEDIVGDE